MKNKSKSFRLGGYSILASAIVIVIAIAANLLMSSLPGKYTKFDTTAKSLYTLSDVTLDMLEKLDKDIDITWLVAEGKEDEQIKLLLQEYLNHSKHLHVKKLDPDLNPNLISQYTSDFYENSFIFTCDNKSRYVDYYDIYTIQYDAQQYYMYGTYDVDFSGENALTGAINYVTNQVAPKLYALKGHGEDELSTNYKAAVKNANIDIEEFSLLNQDDIPQDADSLFINNPKDDISDDELKKLQSYLKRGGHLLLITAPAENGKVLANINRLMEGYGVQAVDGLVIDTNTNNYASNYPMYLLPEIVSSDITSTLKNKNYFILLPFAQGLSVKTVDDESIIVNKLLKTSNKAYSKIAGYNFSTYEKEAGDIAGGFALGVAIMQRESETVKNGARIVWYSSSYLMDEEISKQVAGANQTLFMNSVSWLCNENEAAVGISAKSLAEEKLNMTSSSSAVLSAIFVGIIPLCYLLIGIIIWLKRRHR